jgi:LmbE family N-acetylglucosaminyl deacetylase
MATLVFFHAHPDDESIATGGSMAKYAAEGHRVVLVVATGGEHGEVPADLAPGESLKDRRRGETERSAAILGIAAIHWLGYEDSGMHGWEQNGNPLSFHQAPVEGAAERLAAILRAEGADVLTVYDAHGNYGHPDHIAVHRVGYRAAELTGVAEVYEATMNRDYFTRLVAEAREAGIDLGWDEEDEPETEDGMEFGSPEAVLTTAVDVSGHIDQKRRSIRCHASQVTDSSFFLQMPDEAFARAFGIEWYIRRGAPAGIHDHELVLPAEG